ncbi:cAMP-dependent protein kinase inhibitor beta-like isoform X2 [Euwallacea fornicatus]|uniref:cAMP-dependent protein kinase inhibitor beta-like isoform X2 n=1 Tax=Euwallacea fornicatus TaxID=995702 RepID=UPI00338EA11F
MSMVGRKAPAGRITRSPRKGFSRQAVLKMLAVMEAGSQGAGARPRDLPPPNEPPIQEFLSSGRTGRRNALPDILGQHAVVTSSDLPSRLQALTTKDQGPSTSGESQSGPSSSKS